MKHLSKTGKGIIITIGIVILVLIIALIMILAGGDKGYRSISITDIFGIVTAENNGNSYQAYENMSLSGGYALTTDKDSYTFMLLDDDKYVRLEQESHAVFEELGDDKNRNTVINLEKGVLTTEIVKPLSADEGYVVNTPNAVLSVRGTYFKAAVRVDENGDYYTDVYTYGGIVACKRIMPDGTIVEEEVLIQKGYKACVKMDEIVTIYIEELIEEEEDKVDPIEIGEVSDNDLVGVYNASINGHDMFADSKTLWDEIEERDIDVSKHYSPYDKKPVKPFDKDNHDKDEKNEHDGGNRPSHDNDEKNPPHSTTSVSETSGENTETSISTENTTTASSEAVSAENTESGVDGDTHTGSTAPVIIQTSPQSSSAVTVIPVPETESITTVVPEETVTAAVSEETTTAPYESVDETEEPVRTTEETTTEETTTEETTAETTADETTTTEATATETTEAAETTAATSTAVTTYHSATPPFFTTPVRTTPVVTTTPVITTTTTPVVTTTTVTTTTTTPAETTTVTEAHVCEFSNYISDGNATCTEDGTKTATCECGKTDTITDEGSAKGHTEKTETTDPDCIDTGKTVISCEVCGETISEEEIAALGHTEVEETVEATFAAEGSYTKSCSLCGESLESKVLERLPALYTEDGDITITETGYTQGDATEETAFTGDYVISQRDSSTAADCAIAIESGTHNVMLDGVNIKVTGRNAVEISSGTNVAITGEDDNTFNLIYDTAQEYHSCFYNYGKTEFVSGKFTFSCNGCVVNDSRYGAGGSNVGELVITDGSVSFLSDTTYGVYSDNVFNINGGTVSATGADGMGLLNEGKMNMNKGVLSVSSTSELSFWDQSLTNTGELNISGGKTVLNGVANGLLDTNGLNSSGKTTITGGSVISPVNISCNGTITGGSVKAASVTASNGTDQLECIVFDTFPTEAQRTFINSDGTSYVYALTEDDTADDGKYYVWKPLLAINDIHFPDSVFRTYVSTNFDSDSNGYLSDTEIEAVTEIDVGGSSDADGAVTSLKGIEYFKKLTRLDCGYNTALVSLDVSENPYLNWLYCYGAGLTSLDISKNTALVYLNFGDTNISELDTSKNVALETLTCSDYISSLNLSNNVSLTNLGCINSDITELDLSNNVALRSLNCSATGITKLDLSKNIALSSLSCHDTGITELDLSNNTSLSYLDCYNTGIVELDISKHTNLRYLRCYNLGIKSLDISNNTDLFVLECNDCNLAYVDISKCQDSFNSSNLNLSGNQHPIPSNATTFYTSTIEGFDPTKVSNVANADFDSTTGIFTNIIGDITYTYDCGQGYSEIFTLARTGEAIEGVAVDSTNFPDSVFQNYVSTNFDSDSDGYLSDTEIEAVTEIDISGTSTVDGGVTSLKGVERFTELTTLQCGYNSSLTEIDVSKNIVLTDLDCRNTGITNLDISKNTALEILYCYNIALTSLDVSNNTALELLDCSNTAITSLDLSNNTLLTTLHCAYCYSLTELDVSSNTSLINLYCNSLIITSLDVSKNTALTKLWCFNTGITSLDVSNNTALTYLDCSNTEISSLDVSNNTALTTLQCGSSALSHVDLTNNTNLAIFNASGNKYKISTQNRTVNGLEVSVTTSTTPSEGEYTIEIVDSDTPNAVKNGTLITVYMDLSQDFGAEAFEEIDSYSTEEQINAACEVAVQEFEAALNDAIEAANLGLEDYVLPIQVRYSGTASVEAIKGASATARMYIEEVPAVEEASSAWAYLDFTADMAGSYANEYEIELLADANVTEVTAEWTDNKLSVTIPAVGVYLEAIQYAIDEAAAGDPYRALTVSVEGDDISNIDFLSATWENVTLSGGEDSFFENLSAALITFDTSAIEGFDPTKVSDVSGADFDAATGIFSNITGDITYTYDCGQGYSVTFTLTRTG